jgi:AcrR family transcriptional regulator
MQAARSTSPGAAPAQRKPEARQAPKLPRGRPRHPAINDHVIEATLAILAEEGFAATTIVAVARRSGINSSAIYRRWPSRIELIEEAVFPGLDEVSISPAGDLRRDVRRFIRAYERTFSSPAARAAIPGLLASYHQQGDSLHPAEKWLRVSARPYFRAILQAGGPESVDSTIDSDDVFDLLLGAVLARALVPTVVRRTRSAEHIVDLVVRAVRPDTPSSRRHND